MIINPAPVGEE